MSSHLFICQCCPYHFELIIGFPNNKICNKKILKSPKIKQLSQVHFNAESEVLLKIDLSFEVISLVNFKEKNNIS